jgi:hypothetical protein
MLSTTGVIGANAPDESSRFVLGLDRMAEGPATLTQGKASREGANSHV